MPILPSFLFIFALISKIYYQTWKKKIPPLCCSCRMKNKPPLSLEGTPSFRQKHKKTQTIESVNSGTTSGPPLEFDQPESSLPLSTEPEITSTLDDEFDTIGT